MPRKLERICLDLTQLGEQGKIRGFLSNVGNADQLGGLLEDIRDAVMEYQVRTLHRAAHHCSINVRIRLLCSKISMTRVVGSSWVTSLRPSFVWINRRIGINESYPSKRDGPRHWCWVPLWEQAGMPERDEEGCTVANRTLAVG